MTEYVFYQIAFVLAWIYLLSAVAATWLDHRYHWSKKEKYKKWRDLWR